jgi:hypothetical protein
MQQQLCFLIADERCGIHALMQQEFPGNGKLKRLTVSIGTSLGGGHAA